jgi:hypothetical protein
MTQLPAFPIACVSSGDLGASMLGHDLGDELLLVLAAVCLAVAAARPWLRRVVPERADVVDGSGVTRRRG